LFKHRPGGIIIFPIKEKGYTDSKEWFVKLKENLFDLTCNENISKVGLTYGIPNTYGIP